MPLRMEFTQSLRLEQKLKLAPQIIQSIDILQLPLLELQERIEQELEENPVLEMREVDPDSEEARKAAESGPSAEKEREDKRMEVMDFDPSFREHFADMYPRRRHSGGEEDKKLEAMQNTPSRPESLQDYLFDQFRLLDVPESALGIAENIIYNLDDDGYLQYSLEEIVASMDGVSLEDAENALRLLREAGPPGIGARDLQECLLLQLSEEDFPEQFESLEILIRNHLDDIAANRLPKIVKETGRSMEEVKTAVDTIQKRLNPRPGGEFGARPGLYVVPDVVVELIDSVYEIRLEDARVPGLFVSSAYNKLLKDKKCTAKDREYIQQKIQSAKWLIDSIEQRRNTVYRTSCEIVRIQKGFLDHGIAHLRPLKMQTVADVVGVHVATVSRAIKDKYIQTPRGIFRMKFFFTGATEKADGPAVSRKSVKELVRAQVDDEDKKKPLSDEDIAKALSDESGLTVARRTVTKYRKELKIPSSRQRREY